MVSATRTPTSSAPSQDGVVDYAPAFLPPASSSLTHTSRMDGFCNQNAYQLDSLAGLSFPAVYVGVVDCAPAFLPPASSSPQSSLPTSCLSTAARSSCRLEAAYCNCRRCRLARTRTEKPVRTSRGSGRIGCSRPSAVCCQQTPESALRAAAAARPTTICRKHSQRSKRTWPETVSDGDPGGGSPAKKSRKGTNVSQVHTSLQW